MANFKNLVLGALVTMAGAAHAGGGYDVTQAPQQDMYGGMERSAFFDGGRSRMPGPGQFRNPFQPGRGGPHGRGHGRGMLGQHPHRQVHPLFSPRTAMYWYRLDVANRANLESHFRQWLGTLTAEQQTQATTWINQAWQRMPLFQQQFLSAVFNPTTSTAAASPTTTTTSVAATPATTVTYDPTTGFPIDPSTGYPVDPSTGYLVDPSTGYRYDRTNNVWIDPTTGQAVGASASTTSTTTTTY